MDKLDFPKMSGLCKFSRHRLHLSQDLYARQVLIFARLGSLGVSSPGVRHRRKGEEDDECGQTGAVLLSTER